MTDHALLMLFAGCLLGGVFPWINAELLVLGAVALVDPGQLFLIPPVAALGQMTAKGGLYGLARWAPERLPAKARDALGKARKLGDGPTGVSLVVLVSAGVAIPPFYLVTLAAGVLRVPAPLFLASGLLGMTLRYVALTQGAALVGGVSP